MGKGEDLLLWLGIKMPDLVAGFAGGVVNAFVFSRSSPMAVAGSVVVGGLTANYLGEAATHYLPISVGAASFIMGLGGMAFCQGLVESLRRWRPPLPRGGSNGH